MDYSFQIRYPDTNSICISHVTDAEVSEIPSFPPNITNLVIRSDHIETYAIPRGIKSATVGCLGLKELYVPDGVKYLYCQRNFLRKLELPSSIVHVRAHHNLLTEITFRGVPDDLYWIDIHKNRMCYLDIPVSASLQYLNATFNPCLQELRCQDAITPSVREYLKKQHVVSGNSDSEDDSY